ncbi:hypothetical protein CCAE64S_02337 [Castellaniella caeni]
MHTEALTHGFQQMYRTHDVTRISLYRRDIRLPHKRLRCQVQDDFRLCIFQSLRERSKVANITL